MAKGLYDLSYDLIEVPVVGYEAVENVFKYFIRNPQGSIKYARTRGVNLQKFVFELPTESTMYWLREEIYKIQRYEPSVQLKQVDISIVSEGKPGYDISIHYYGPEGEVKVYKDTLYVKVIL